MTSFATTDDLRTLFPQEVDAYRLVGEELRYDRATLHELLNGGSEVYLSLNVVTVIHRVYQCDHGPDLLVDVFDMGSANDAFGAYHHDMREGPGAGIGQESELAGSSLFFWRDRYFVSVVARADTAVALEGVIAMATRIAGRIGRDGPFPEVVRWLPEHGLVRSQIHYFHTWQLLGRYYHMPSDNPLLLGDDTEGVIARYRPSGVEASTLILIRYPSVERAVRAHARMTEAHAPGVCSLRRDVLGCVLDAPTRQSAADLLVAVFRGEP